MYAQQQEQQRTRFVVQHKCLRLLLFFSQYVVYMREREREMIFFFCGLLIEGKRQDMREKERRTCVSAAGCYHHLSHRLSEKARVFVHVEKKSVIVRVLRVFLCELCRAAAAA